MLGEDGRPTIAVDVALRWGIGYETYLVRSFVNAIATPRRRTHTTGFEQGPAMRKVPADNARKASLWVTTRLRRTRLAGLTAVLTVRLAEPQFEGADQGDSGTYGRQIVSKVG